MAENEVRLTNGRRWTAQQFVDHYFEPTASGTPTPVTGPPSPVDVDRGWYMGEGPGRYYHPGMFPIINRLIERHDLAPGTYNLLDFVPNKEKRDSSLTATVSNYTTDMRSTDYPLRALVFGSESARISGQVVVNRDGSKTFKQIEIRPLDTNFDFEHNTWQPALETARENRKKSLRSEKSRLLLSDSISWTGAGAGCRTSLRYFYRFTTDKCSSQGVYLSGQFTHGIDAEHYR